MFKRKPRIFLMVLAIAVVIGNVAWVLGFKLGETKEQLKLAYDVSMTDHGTGRVTVKLEIADPGRLAPLSSVYLVVPGESGTGHVDLSLAVETRKVDKKQVARVHLLKELAARAELQLRTNHLDGKQTPMTWYYHAIPLSEHIKDADAQAKKRSR